MIIENQDHPVVIHRDEYVNASNGGGNCPEVTKARVPTGHIKAGRGPVFALRDTEDPSGKEILFTVEEFDLFVQAWVSGKFDHLRETADELAPA